MVKYGGGLDDKTYGDAGAFTEPPATSAQSEEDEARSILGFESLTWCNMKSLIWMEESQ